MKNWLRLACREDVVARAGRIALLVGTLLVIINQGAVILRAEITGPLMIRVLLTCLVPYGVATYGAVEALQ